MHLIRLDAAVLPESTCGSVTNSPARSPDSPDAGHMLATTPDSQKRRIRSRMEGSSTPNPLYELDDTSQSSPCVSGSSVPPPLDLAELTPRSDMDDDSPQYQVITCGFFAQILPHTCSPTCSYVHSPACFTFASMQQQLACMQHTALMSYTGQLQVQCNVCHIFAACRGR